MRIEIRVRPARAPCGEVSAEGGPARSFDGWLQLLAILGDLLPRPGAPETVTERGGDAPEPS